MNYKILIIGVALLSLWGCSSSIDDTTNQLPCDNVSENNKISSELKSVLSVQIQNYISKYSPNLDYSFVLLGKTFGASDSDYRFMTFLPANIGDSCGGSINLNDIRLEIASNAISVGKRYFLKYQIEQHLISESIKCTSTESGIIPLSDELILIKRIEVEGNNTGVKSGKFMKINAMGNSKSNLETNRIFTQKNEYLLVVFVRDKFTEE